MAAADAQFPQMCEWLEEVLRVERSALVAELEKRHSKILLSLQGRGSKFAEGAASPALAGDMEPISEDAVVNPMFQPAEHQSEQKESDVEAEAEDPFSARTTSTRTNPLADKKTSLINHRCSLSAWVHSIVTSDAFEIVFAVLIIMNSVIMACESQYIAFDLGHKLKYPHFEETATDVWPGADVVLKVLSYFFGVVFTMEIVMKLVGLGKSFAYDYWNWFDSMIVTVWLVDTLLADFVTMPLDPMLLRLARLLRLLRLLKLAKTIRGVDPLFLMMTTLKGSVAALFWVFVLLLVAQTMFGFVLNQCLVTYYLNGDSGDDRSKQEVFKYFGSWTRSVLSMFEITLGNWVPIARLLYDDISPWFIIFSILHKLTMGFSVIAVINGIFIQETFKVAASDDILMTMQKERAMAVHAKKMNKFFKAADSSGDGVVDKDELREILKVKEVRTWLAAQDLTANDSDSLYTLLDKDGAGVSAVELVKGVSELKGSARSMDMVLLTRKHADLMTRVQEMDKCLVKLYDLVLYSPLRESAIAGPSQAPSQDASLPSAEVTLGQLQHVLISAKILFNEISLSTMNQPRQLTTPTLGATATDGKGVQTPRCRMMV